MIQFYILAGLSLALYIGGTIAWETGYDWGTGLKWFSVVGAILSFVAWVGAAFGYD